MYITPHLGFSKLVKCMDKKFHFAQISMIHYSNNQKNMYLYKSQIFACIIHMYVLISSKVMNNMDNKMDLEREKLLNSLPSQITIKLFRTT